MGINFQRTKSTYRRIRGRFNTVDLTDSFEMLGNLSKYENKLKVFQTWRSSKFDRQHASVILDLKNKNPSVPFFLFRDEEMKTFMHLNFSGNPILDIFTNCRYMASKADIWRLCVLYLNGGYYLDIDSTAKFDLQEKVNHKDSLISYSQEEIFEYTDLDSFPEDIFFFENFQYVKSKLLHPSKLMLNWLMYFTPRHPVLGIALNEICTIAPSKQGKKFPDVRQAVVHLAGPVILTRAVWKYVLSGGIISEETYDFGDDAIFRAIDKHSLFFAGERYVVGKDPIVLR